MPINGHSATELIELRQYLLHSGHRHKAAANSTVIDSDNVMLLRSICSEEALPVHMPIRRDTFTPSGHAVVVAEHVDRIDDETIVWFGATETDDPLAVRQAIPPMPGRRIESHILNPTSRSALDGTTR